MHEARGKIEDSVVRLHYDCTEEQARAINPTQVARELYNCGAYYVSEVKASIKRPARSRLKEAGMDLEPLKALRLWFEAARVPGEDHGELAARAGELLQEVGMPCSL